MAKKIKINVYTYFSRRVFIYSPRLHNRFFKYFTLTRNEHNFYAEAILAVLNTVKSLGFKDEIIINVRSWTLWFWYSFLKGGFKSPSITVNGHLFSSGEIPDSSKLKAELSKIYKKMKFLEE